MTFTTCFWAERLLLTFSILCLGIVCISDKRSTKTTDKRSPKTYYAWLIWFYSCFPRICDEICGPTIYSGFGTALFPVCVLQAFWGAFLALWDKPELWLRGDKAINLKHGIMEILDEAILSFLKSFVNQSVWASRSLQSSRCNGDPWWGHLQLLEHFRESVSGSLQSSRCNGGWGCAWMSFMQ